METGDGAVARVIRDPAYGRAGGDGLARTHGCFEGEICRAQAVRVSDRDDCASADGAGVKHCALTRGDHGLAGDGGEVDAPVAGQPGGAGRGELPENARCAFERPPPLRGGCVALRLCPGGLPGRPGSRSGHGGGRPGERRRRLLLRTRAQLDLWQDRGPGDMRFYGWIDLGAGAFHRGCLGGAGQVVIQRHWRIVMSG